MNERFQRTHRNWHSHPRSTLWAIVTDDLIQSIVFAIVMLGLVALCVALNETIQSLVTTWSQVFTNNF